MAADAEIVEREIPDATPVREVTPVEFFNNRGDAVRPTMDLTPTITHVFKDEHGRLAGAIEDGHGRKYEADPPPATRHPSELSQEENSTTDNVPLIDDEPSTTDNVDEEQALEVSGATVLVPPLGSITPLPSGEETEKSEDALGADR